MLKLLFILLLCALHANPAYASEHVNVLGEYVCVRTETNTILFMAVDEGAKTLRFSSSGKAGQNAVPIERRTKEALYSAVVPSSTGFTVQWEVKRLGENRYATHENLYVNEYISWDRDPRMKKKLGWDSDLVTGYKCEKTI